MEVQYEVTRKGDTIKLRIFTEEEEKIAVEMPPSIALDIATHLTMKARFIEYQEREEERRQNESSGELNF